MRDLDKWFAIIEEQGRQHTERVKASRESMALAEEQSTLHPQVMEVIAVYEQLTSIVSRAMNMGYEADEATQTQLVQTVRQLREQLNVLIPEKKS